MTSQSYSEDSSRPGSLSSADVEEAAEREKSVWQGCLRERRAMRVFETGVRVVGEERREGPVRFRVAARLRLMSVTVALFVEGWLAEVLGNGVGDLWGKEGASGVDIESLAQQPYVCMSE